MLIGLGLAGGHFSRMEQDRVQLQYTLYNHRRRTGQARYFQSCFLPLYLPITEVLRPYLRQLMDNEGQGSVRNMLDHRHACARPCDARQGLANLNTPEQWQTAITNGMTL
ncbi:hypothetical protein [Bowmanella pacifica]|uniref:Uncharacterized protein n=1 Tax=Bowmanella pacifica TaxID=502051 RepID=A0A918DJL2_9ALTE|nr:hypothetical protein [Bowmanella pacifica]GGO70591.1 hypothetical protein GCM10010982_24470 [Bowmanella pacifica]